MPLVINTNVASLNAQRQLMKTSDAISASLPRLSSGLRLDSSRESAASSAISEAMKSKISGVGKAQQNAQDAVSLVQTAEGGLTETTAILSRMKELTLQAVNETNSDIRGSLNAEFSTLKSAAVRIASDASFNNTKLFKLDSDTPTQITSGTAQLDQRQIALISSGNPDDGILSRSYDGFSLTSDAFDISDASSAEQRQGVLKALDAMISGVSTARYALGAFQSEVISSVPSPSTNDDPGVYTPTRASIPDYDFASEMANSRNAMLQQAGVSALSQAKNMPQLALALLRG